MSEKLPDKLEILTTPESKTGLDLERRLGESACQLVSVSGTPESLSETEISKRVAEIEELMANDVDDFVELGSAVQNIIKMVDGLPSQVRTEFLEKQLQNLEVDTESNQGIFLSSFLTDYMSDNIREKMVSWVDNIDSDSGTNNIPWSDMMLMSMANHLPEKRRHTLVSQLLEQASDESDEQAKGAQMSLSLGLRHLDSPDHDKVLSLALENNLYSWLFIDPRNLSEADLDTVFNHAINHEGCHDIMQAIDRFSDDQIQQALEGALISEAPYGAYSVLNNIDKLSSKQTQFVIDTMLDLDKANTLLNHADKFNAEQIDVIINRLKESGQIDILLHYADKLSKEQVQPAVDKAAEESNSFAIIANPEFFSPDKVQTAVDNLLKSWGIYDYNLLGELKKLTEDQQKQIVTAVIGRKNYADIVSQKSEVERVTGMPIYQIDGMVEWLSKNKKYGYLLSVFTEMAPDQQKVALSGLWSSEEQAKSLKFLGISEVATEGAEQLHNYFSSFKTRMFDDMEAVADPVELRGGGDIAALALADASEFLTREGKWGDRTMKNLSNYIDYRAGIEVEPLKAGYRPSEIYKISSVSEKSQRDLLEMGEFSWGEGVESRYTSLRNDIIAASEMYGNPHTIVQKIRELRSEVRSLQGSLENDWNETLVANNLAPDFVDIDNLTDKKVRFSLLNIAKQRDTLASVADELSQARPSELLKQMESPQKIGEYFDAIYTNISSKNRSEKLDSLMRQMTFAWALDRNPQFLESMRQLSDEINIDDVAEIREFVEHIVNQETFGEYFTDKQQSRAFKGLTGTKSLEEAMVRYSHTQTRSGSSEVQFIPTRSVLADIAGQLGNSCYADTEKSMVEAHPNITAVIMRSQPGTANERIVGTSLFIETTNQTTNKPILVIRAMNPGETYITRKVAVDEFYQAMIDYAKKQASDLGMEAGIVIDDRSGGCGTNRPVLHGYMLGERSKLKPVRVDAKDSTFNGYNISRGKVFAL